MIQTSEFGRGLTYNLGLFLAHEGRALEMARSYSTCGLSKDAWVSTWFNGASDHLYELEIPETLPQEIKTRLKALAADILDCGHGKGLMGERVLSKDDVYRCLDEAKDLLLEIDKHYGVDAIKADYP